MRAKLMMVLGFFSLLTACGGGGGGSAQQSALTPIAANRSGTYVLTSDTSELTAVATSTRQVATYTPNSTPPFTGTLKLGATSWNHTLNTGDGSGNITAVGSYSFAPASDTSGRFSITNSAGNAAKTGSYSITGANDITLVYDQETVGSYRIVTTERWNKVSDTL